MLALATMLLTLILGVSAFWLAGIIRWRLRQEPSRPSAGARLSTPLLAGGTNGERNSELPTISIIVAGRNEERYVQTCLESLLLLDYPADKVEILFVDDHSTDRTHELATQLSMQAGGRLRVMRAPETPVSSGPKKHALTYAVQASRGDMLLFTDADAAVQSGWARAIVQCYDQDTGAVAGATLPPEDHGVWRRLFRGERLMIALTSASAIGYGSPASVTGQNFSFRRSVFDQLGGYAHPDVPSGDDDLMAQTIARQGWKVKFAADPQSVVSDLRPPTARSHIHSAARHQSTVRYYPVRWRIVYLLSILSAVALLTMGAGALLASTLFLPFLLALSFKLIMDTSGTMLLARRLKLKVDLLNIMTWQLLLPFYLLLRPLALFKPTFTWRDRAHARTPETVRAAS